MEKESRKTSYKTYIVTWLILLTFSLVMIFVDDASVSRVLIISFLVAAMLTKASLIGANFMHLRSEKVGLVVIVAAGILLTAGFMFFIMALDGLRVHGLSQN